MSEQYSTVDLDVPRRREVRPDHPCSSSTRKGPPQEPWLPGTVAGGRSAGKQSEPEDKRTQPHV